MKVMVTGGSGMLGHYVISELVSHDYHVLNADVARPGDLSHSGTGNASRETAVSMRDEWGTRVEFVRLDVTVYGQVVSALEGCAAVVHLAAAPTNVGFIEEVVFAGNTTSMWNVMRAAEQVGVSKVVLGSSYNAIGGLGTTIQRRGRLTPPDYFPIDEEHPTRVKDAYSVSKWVGEQVADAFARRDPDMQLASMRFNGMWDDGRMSELHASPIMDAGVRASSFWSYLHLKDAAHACRMAIEADWNGHHRFFLNARDTMLGMPTADAIAKVYPSVPMRRRLGEFEAPIETARAKRLFDWEPLYSWRDERFAR